MTTLLAIHSVDTRGYDVLIGQNLLSGVGELVTKALARRRLEGRAGVPITESHGCRRAFVVADTGVSTDTVAGAVAALISVGYVTSVMRITPSERVKCPETWGRILAEVASTRHERHDPIIAIGGGIVGDMAGFAAACYRRGVPVVQCPTTLLAMVDASIGGKTAVNLLADAGGSLLKNMAGAFHRPCLVVADTSVLGALDARHYRSGIAECIKHGLIGAHANDPSLLDWTVSRMPAILARREPELSELVHRNVAVKRVFVEADETEDKPGDDPASGPSRVALNLGHTFGHAFESIAAALPGSGADSAPLHHGEAVAMGLVAAARLSSWLGRSGPELAALVERAVVAAGLPISVRSLPDTDTVLALMQHDKKTAGGRIRLVLPVEGRLCEVVTDAPRELVQKAIDSLRF